MNIQLYKNFSKRANSTKQPTGTYDTKNVALKDKTNVKNPVFVLSGYDPTYNYIYVPTWNRYYFIDDVVLGNTNLFEVHCSCDVLATFKSVINTYTCFVERTSDTTKYDVELYDTAISSKEKVIHSSQATTNLIGAGGVVICRVMNSSHGITTYIGAMSNFDGLFNPISDDPSILDTIEAILQYYLYNPASYVIDCYFLAVPLGSIPDKTADVIECGWSGGNGGAYRYTGTTGIIDGEVTLAKPSRYYNDFRESANAFSQYYIYIPSVGEVPLSSDLIDTTLSLAYAVDIFTGETSFRLYSTASSKTLVATYHGNIKAPLITGSMMPNAGSVVTSVAGGVATAVTGNPIGIGMATLNAVQNIISPTPSINGSQGSCAGYITNPNVVISEVAKDSAESPNTLGKPCNKNLQLGTVSGYIQCAGASIDITGFASDKEQVNAYLNGGFYYE